MPLGDAMEGLATLTVVIVAALLAGALFGRIGQPKVLGPILLGVLVATGLAAAPESLRVVLISPTSRSLIEAAGTAGLLLLMFSVGAKLRSFGKTDDVTAGWRLVPSIVVPIAVCGLAAWPFAERLGTPEHPGPHGWLFVGIALGVTAVPVLVTIVTDLGIGTLTVSRVALRIAVVTDGFAWILVTVLVIVTTNLSTVSLPALGAGVGLLVAVAAVLPRLVGHVGAGSLVGLMVVAALAGAAATQLLGFHPAVGAVIAGFCFPGAYATEAPQRIFASVVDVLLPAFFVSAAMSVPLQALRDQMSWGGLWCAVVLTVVAVVSKLAAGMVFGTIHRWQWRSSARLGVLLNCRGVTEIAIASVGYQAGLISPFAFAALCGVAIVTTAATAPLWRALDRGCEVTSVVPQPVWRQTPGTG